jgi:hypothetical protein
VCVVILFILYINVIGYVFKPSHLHLFICVSSGEIYFPVRDGKPNRDTISNTADKNCFNKNSFAAETCQLPAGGPVFVIWILPTRAS